MSYTFLKCLVGFECHVQEIWGGDEYIIVDVCSSGKEAILLNSEGSFRYAPVTSLCLTQKSRRRLLDKMSRSA